MRAVFYEPNIKLMKTRYERNCKLLSKYPYMFRKDLLPFEELPIHRYGWCDYTYAQQGFRFWRYTLPRISKTSEDKAV